MKAKNGLGHLCEVVGVSAEAGRVRGADHSKTDAEERLGLTSAKGQISVHLR